MDDVDGVVHREIFTVPAVAAATEPSGISRSGTSAGRTEPARTAAVIEIARASCSTAASR